MGSLFPPPPTLGRILRAFEGERGPAAAPDRAFLLLGISGHRVSELTSLCVEDIEMADEG